MSAKMLALVLGIIVVIVGLLGFVANPLVGATGMFLTNAALNVVYIIIGAVLIIVSVWASAQSGLWLKIGGVIYLIVAILGFLMASPVLGFLAVNMATNWLHVVLGIVMLAAGFWGTEGMAMDMNRPAAM
ncbi:MAG TPA: DUF4383 domain-containing protein [Candidatus Paceibacterota bacterium]